MTKPLPIYIIMLMLFVASFPVQTVSAQSRNDVEKSTDIVMLLPGAIGAAAAVVEKDGKGFLQLVESEAASVAVAYLLKYAVEKRRPDGSDMHSFPSNHMGIAVSGATFLQRRYGWKLGVPAYALSTYVAWGRIYAKRHDVWDVLAGTAIGIGSALVFTRPFAEKNKIVVAPMAWPDGGGLMFTMNL
ncbi:MAG: phosphatase PAP2 family protein [Prevotella sp.]|nr:phosphatase PAP2 family protein [Prevotella sp.]